MKPLDQILLEARKDAQLTQQDLATQIGKREADVSRWERGQNIPENESLVRLADALGLDKLVVIEAAVRAGHSKRRRGKRP